MSEATCKPLRADRCQRREHGRCRVRPGRRPAHGVPVRGGAGARVHQAAAVAGVRATCRSRREAQLVANLRAQLEALNSITFTDAEWERFFTEQIAGANDGIVEKTVRIQEDHVQLLKRDDGSTKNITLIDKTNIHNNRLQVINQYEIGQGEGGASTLEPLRRDGARQRPAAGARRAQAPRRRHPRGVQPDRPLPARQLLGRLGPVRVRPALRDQQRHADEVLLQHHPPPAPRRDAAAQARRARRRNSFEFTSWWADAHQQADPGPDRRSPRRSSPSTRCSTS